MNSASCDRCRALQNLWECSKSKFNKELLCYANRGFVYSNIENINPILICGINPFYGKQDIEKKEYCFGFQFHEVIDSNRYYSKIKSILPESKYNYEYTDLFYVRGAQFLIKEFTKDADGLKFMSEQLRITQELIEKIKPKCILIFNKESHHYWGAHSKKFRSQNKNIWLGYEFQNHPKFNQDNIKIIKGISKDEEKVSKNLLSTNLLGVPVYFSKYLGRISSSDKEIIKDDLLKIITNLD